MGRVHNGNGQVSFEKVFSVGALVLLFAGYVQLASQNPYPTIV